MLALAIEWLPELPAWLAERSSPLVRITQPDAISLSQVLSSQDLATYSEAIRAERDGNWAAMDALLAKVHNPVLKPTLLAQRWLEGRYTKQAGMPDVAVLERWLQENPKHPYSMHMERLVQSLRPQTTASTHTQKEKSSSGAFLASRLRHGSLASEPTLRYTDDALALSALNAKERGLVQNAMAEFQLRMQDDKRQRALNTAEKSLRGLSPLAQDMLRWQQANILFSYGDMASALRLGASAADRSGQIQPAMHWVAGMAAWQQGLYARARHHFHLMAQNAKKLPAGDAAAALFWAARAWEKTDHANEAQILLQHAATYGESFYAHLARQQLQQPASTPALSIRQHTRLMAQGLLDPAWASRHPGAVRALAWQQLGQKNLARWELAYLFDSTEDDADRAVLAHLTGVMNLPDMQLAMSRKMARPYSRLSSYPIPSWKPVSGFEVEQALLLGIARQESGFDVSATSPAGASGLMQLMPETANYIARLQPGGKATGQSPEARAKTGLNDPITNLTLAQSYLQYLAQKPYVDHNLVLLIAAYNAGPKAVIGWSNRLEENMAQDPIAFIETLSYSETRSYVQHVLANSWTYHELLGTRPDSLRLLAQNDWPQLGNGRSWFAERAMDDEKLAASMPLPTPRPQMLAQLPVSGKAKAN